MQTPPIPPKSRFLALDRERGAYSTHDSQWPYLDYMNEDERFLIAAVAEVEWRKRAERWSNLQNRILARTLSYRKFGTTASIRKQLNPRKEKFREAAHKCFGYALAWRAWGEQK